MVWGGPKSNASNGDWIDYSYGKGRGGYGAGGWGRQRGSGRPWQHRGEGGGKNANAINDMSPKDITPAILAAWTAKNNQQMQALMTRVMKTCNKEPQAAAGTGKPSSWKCECGYLNYGFRRSCKDCACEKHEEGSEGPLSPAPATAGTSEGGTMAMQAEASSPEPATSPEQKVKQLDSLIKAVSVAVPSKAKDASLALYAQEMQQAKSEVLLAKPLPSRLQAAVSRQAAAAKECAAAVAADVQFQQISQAKGRLAAEAVRKKDEADREVLEIQALLGRPQLEAGAAAAVSLCLSMLKANGLAEHLVASLDGALRAALSGQPEVVMASSPFAGAGGSQCMVPS